MITAGWSIIYIATSVQMLCYARILHGIGIGIARTINPMYVSEVADINIRGMLGTLITVAACTGTLIAYGLEYWMKYDSLLVVFIILSSISFLLNMCFPETPYFLVAKGRKKEACKSLTYYKGIIDPNKARTEIRALRAQTIYELHPQSRYKLDLQSNVDSRASDDMDEIHMDGSKRSAFTKVQVIIYRSNKKALFIMFGLIMAQQCGKNFITMQYPERLYRKIDIVGDSYTATLLVQVVSILSSIFTMFKVDSVGRRTLLILSTLGTSVTLCTFAYYLLLAEHKLQGHMFDVLLPIVIIVYQVTFQIGLGTIPTVFLCELFPMELRGYVGATTLIFDSAIELTVSILYQFLTDIIGAVYFIFATVCILAFLMVFIAIPETKGKTYNEIESLLVGKN
ncbi:facilitated trehalose transporter Tret1-like [Bombus pascuorum]|uniref:facilitated trehalose transporter Tret1-like n=1 Tax=Bombus pascuorum TaxID=65598 RepID=UPI00298E4AC1|nr:facilitated trehalose transporter Tret1-like [Bombus pascuorum]